MSCKYVVSNLNTNKDYIFYDFSKFSSDNQSVKLIEDGLKNAKNKYDELLTMNNKYKLIITKVHPNYHTGKIETDLIQSNI